MLRTGRAANVEPQADRLAANKPGEGHAIIVIAAVQIVAVGLFGVAMSFVLGVILVLGLPDTFDSIASLF